MSTNHAPELVAALNDFADWLFRHNDLPRFCNADFEDEYGAGQWLLRLQVSRRDDDQTLTDLERFAEVLDSQVTTEPPCTARDGYTFISARVTALLSKRLRVVVWGHLDGPDVQAAKAA